MYKSSHRRSVSNLYVLCTFRVRACYRLFGSDSLLRHEVSGNVRRLGAKYGRSGPFHAIGVYRPNWPGALACSVARYVVLELHCANSNSRGCVLRLSSPSTVFVHCLLVFVAARAIESQCYVIAAAQYGKHNAKRESYGHSIVIDPWGEILVDAGGFDSENKSSVSTPNIITCNIELNKVAAIRERMPIQQHRDNAKFLVPRRANCD